MRAVAVQGACPHPWPVHGPALPASTALLVVGSQRAIAANCAGASHVSATISAVATAMRSWGARVVWTRHARSPAKPSLRLLPYAHGPERGPRERRREDMVALAYGVDGFSASPLAECLRGWGVTDLVVTGFGLETFVHSTLRSANDRGWDTLLVPDGCAPFEPALFDAALEMVEADAGEFGTTASAQELLKAIQQAAEPPER